MTVRALRNLFIGALGGFSIALIVCELQTSQAFVRHYLSDIHGAETFHGVNTTVSVSLLWGTALLFAVTTAVLGSAPAYRRLRLFTISQVAVFGFLGLDDRFQVHERLARRLGIDDHWVLFAVALLEVLFLVSLGGREVLRHPTRRFLAVAVALFGVMFVIDAFVPGQAVLRLTIEDLAKTWSALFFLVWAWKRLFLHIGPGECDGNPDSPKPPSVARG